MIQPNYLTSQQDVDTLVAGVKASIKLLDTKAMQKVGAEQWEVSRVYILPPTLSGTQAFPACAKDHQWDSKAYWECYVRHFSYTVYHPVGTCAMGSVLDQR